MKRCAAKPYEGGENYIFVSYCHKDKKFIFPIIERLARDGYRVWYDEGIDPGSEWPEIIARHLNGCATCIAFISENSLNSHNCRREINFALLKKKPFISVVIEPVQMSLGMEMQLSATQSIFKYTLSDDNEFFSKLYDAKCLCPCLGTPDTSVLISKPEDYEEGALGGLFGESNLRRETFSDKWFLEGEDSDSASTDKPIVEADTEKDEKPIIVPVVTDETHTDEVEVAETKNEHFRFWLLRAKTNETIELPQGEFKLGRSNVQSDYVISGNSGIGRLHAKIIVKENQCFVVDNSSMNKTYLNSQELEPQKEYLLENGDSIRLMNEKFTFHQEKE